MYSILETPNNPLILEIRLKKGVTYSLTIGIILEFNTENLIQTIQIKGISTRGIVFDNIIIGTRGDMNKRDNIDKFVSNFKNAITNHAYKDLTPSAVKNLISSVYMYVDKKKYGGVIETTDEYIPLPKIDPLISKNIINEKY